MIAVAPDLAFPAAQVFLVTAEQPVFIHDQHAEAVAGFEQFRRGRIVRSAIGVAAHLLQLRDAEILQRVRQRRAHAGMVLVIARAFENVRLAVQQKSLVLVECHGADAELGFLAVNHFAVRFNRRDELVKFRGFGRPEFGFGNKKAKIANSVQIPSMREE
jgi:hypothetical protein